MKELEYPFDSNYILKKKKLLKRLLLEQKNQLLEKRIAILGGSTTNEVRLVLELFLLNYNIKPIFYESEYDQYYQDAMFGNEVLSEFKPDIIYIHTTNRNIFEYPRLSDGEEIIGQKLNSEFKRFNKIWEKLHKTYNCPIIQNNFELPFYRLLGNKDASSVHGKVNFINRLNLKFCDYANSHDNFYINDINYISASYGIEKWADQHYWHMYKYALALPAIPILSFNIANIIKSIYGKNKKGLVLDLDNTLWGGIIGDDGLENISIGPETSLGQVYSEFQQYIKDHKQIGIILNINSKNEKENALLGLSHQDGALSEDDFVVIKANWEPKSKNMLDIANELNLGVDSLVFVDDNPAERAIVNQYLPEVYTPEMITPEQYINIIDKSGFFEVTNISKEDTIKTEMYKDNVARSQLIHSTESYEDYLTALEMEAEIKSFGSMYFSRITQLTNKSNQFNLTTKRYSQSDVEEISSNNEYIKIYGKLKDVFGDNGVVSVVIGKIEATVLHIDLWIMSCRVLKRDMEFAMMDKLVEHAKARDINLIYGYYYPTKKNSMVKNFYELQGFKKIEEDEEGNSKWEFYINENYINKNKFIKVEE